MKAPNSNYSSALKYCSLLVFSSDQIFPEVYIGHLIKGQTRAAAPTDSTDYRERGAFVLQDAVIEIRPFVICCGYRLCRPVFTHDQ